MPLSFLRCISNHFHSDKERVFCIRYLICNLSLISVENGSLYITLMFFYEYWHMTRIVITILYTMTAPSKDMITTKNTTPGLSKGAL